MVGFILHRRRGRPGKSHISRDKHAAVAGWVDSVPHPDLGIPSDFNWGPGEAPEHAQENVSSAFVVPMVRSAEHAAAPIGDAVQPPRRAYATRDMHAGVAVEGSEGSVSSWDAARPLWAEGHMHAGPRGCGGAQTWSGGPTRRISAGEAAASHDSAHSGTDRRHTAAGCGEVEQAVASLQGALRAELHSEELQLHGVLGRGGFGTVYHGVSTPLFL